MIDSDELRRFLINRAVALILKRGGTGPEVTDDFSFIESGLMDSLGFVEFIEEIEQTFKIEIAFQNIDPTQFTTIGGMVLHLSVNGAK